MKLYAVFQEGVYRHACCGIFSTEDAAKACADKCAAADRDNYHAYEVFPFDMNEEHLPVRKFIPTSDGASFECDPTIAQPERVYSVSKPA